MAVAGTRADSARSAVGTSAVHPSFVAVADTIATSYSASWQVNASLRCLHKNITWAAQLATRSSVALEAVAVAGPTKAVTMSGANLEGGEKCRGRKEVVKALKCPT